MEGVGNDESVATNVRANVLASVGQLEQTEVQQPILPFGATSLPTTAKSSSSNRRRAAYACHGFTLAGSSAKKLKKHRKRARQKQRKQDAQLVAVVPCDGISSSILNEYFVFVNGDVKNAPINPSINNSMNKPIKILSVAKGDLHAPQHHIEDPSKGLICRVNDNLDTASNFVLVPRSVALERTACLKMHATNLGICEALDAYESAARNTQPRGNQKHVVLEQEHDKYICTGTQVRRGGRGVDDMHYIMRSVDIDHNKNILKLFRGIEKLFDEWLETKQVGLVHAAIDLIDPEVFSDGQSQHARIYGGIASGRNVYLNAHRDEDFTFSAVTIHLKDCEYTITDPVVAYFCFPRLGIAVPLRPGDVLFFNPQEEHCVSSRCHSEDLIYCVSLYLKSANLGLNDNSIKLTPREKSCLAYFNANLK